MVTLPSSPALDLVTGHQVREHGEHAGDAGSEAVAGYGVMTRDVEVWKEGGQSLVHDRACEVFPRAESEDWKVFSCISCGNLFFSQVPKGLDRAAVISWKLK